MADDLQMRASDADRSEITNFLSDSLAKGFITTEEMSHRVESALSSKTFADLLALVRDIPGGKEVVKRSAGAHLGAANRGISSSNALDFHGSYGKDRTTHRRFTGRKVILIAGIIMIGWLGISMANLAIHLIFGPVLALIFPLLIVAIAFLALRSFVRPGRFGRR